LVDRKGVTAALNSTSGVDISGVDIANNHSLSDAKHTQPDHLTQGNRVAGVVAATTS
jgi:hypothetical protein